MAANSEPVITKYKAPLQAVVGEKEKIYTSTHVLNRVFTNILSVLSNVNYEIINKKFDKNWKGLLIVKIGDGDIRIYEKTGNIILKGSDSFCDFYNSSNESISMSAGGPSGAFSTAGDYTLLKRKPLFSQISINSKKGSFSVYYMETIAKKPKNTNNEAFKDIDEVKYHYEHCINDRTKKNKLTMILSDPVYETVIGSFITMLFDLGLTPSVPKYIAFYSCEKYNKNQSSNPNLPNAFFIMEKSNYTLLDLYTKDKYLDTLLRMNVYDHIMMYFQIAHTFMQMYLYFGIVHFDAHINNIMLTVVNQELDKNTPPLKLMYDGKDLNDAKYYCYHLPITDNNGNRKKIYIKNNGILPKVIDYGNSMADLSKSTKNKDLNLRFINRYSNYGVNLDKCDLRNTKEGYINWLFNMKNMANLPFNYFLNISVTAMCRLVESNGNPKKCLMGLNRDNQVYNEDNMPIRKNYFLGIVKNNVFQEFVKTVSGGLLDIKKYLLDKNFAKEDPPLLLKFVYGEAKWGENRRFDAGTSDNPVNPVVKILEFLNKAGGNNGNDLTNVGLDSVGVTVMGDPSIFEQSQNLVHVDRIDSKSFSIQSRFFDFVKQNMKHCSKADQANTEPCKKLKNTIYNYSPDNVLFHDFYNDFVEINAENNFRKIKTNDLYNICFSANKEKYSPMKCYSTKLNINNKLKAISMITKLRIIPELQDVNIRRFLKYKKSHRIFNYMSPPNEVLGKDIENITANIVIIDSKYYKPNIRLEKKTIFDVAEGIDNGFVTNGGYFIVSHNVNNRLTNWITRDDLDKPIGFYYNSEDRENSGTTLPFPSHYRKHLAVLWCDGNNKIHFTKSDEFYGEHKRQRVSNICILNDGDGIDIKTPVIVMSNNNIPLDKEGNEVGYKSAIETGPILIWNGEIVFNRNVMEEEEFMIDENDPNSKKFRVSEHALNNKKFFNEENESVFLYGQRHSNSFIVHNVLCELNDGNIMIFLLEGRGYDSIGLDRVQLAKLINRFDVKHAVSLDGGFSAGIVRVSDKNRHWVNIDPQRRAISTALVFSQK